MATRIRLSRVGRKKQASFRIVVAGSMHARGGRVSETIGRYNPRTQPSHIEIDEARALYWLREGAKLSESVEPLFRKAGIMKKYAEGAAGEGLVVIGDPHGKTRPREKIAVVEPPEAKPAEKKAKPKKEKAAKPAEAEAPEAAAPEAAAPEAAEAPAEAGEEPAAEEADAEKQEGES